MQIYHGSSVIVEKPELSKGKQSNDYGRGFYCTEDIEMAKEWACKGKEPPAFANVYELDCQGLKVLDLSAEPFTVLNWIAVLLANRTFQLDLEIAVEVRDYFLANFMPPIGADGRLRISSGTGTVPSGGSSRGRGLRKSLRNIRFTMRWTLRGSSRTS